MRVNARVLAAIAATAPKGDDVRIRLAGRPHGCLFAWADADASLTLLHNGAADVVDGTVDRDWLRDCARTAGAKAVVALGRDGNKLVARWGDGKRALATPDLSGDVGGPVTPIAVPPSAWWAALVVGEWTNGGAVMRAAVATTPDAWRPYSGVLLRPADCVGTDGHKAVSHPVQWPCANIVLPARAAGLVASLLTKLRNDTLHATVEGPCAWFRAGGGDAEWTLAVVLRHAPADFPNVDAAVPSDATLDGVANVDADDLRAMVSVYRRDGGQVALYRDGTILAWSARLEAGWGGTVAAPPVEPPVTILGTENIAKVVSALPARGAVPLRYATAGDRLTAPVKLHGQCIMPMRVDVPARVLQGVREAFE